MNRKVSICMPVIRVEQSLKCIEAILENVGIPHEDYEIVTAIDYERIGFPLMFKNLVERAKYDLICLLADDTFPKKDFLKIALDEMDKLPDGWGVVGFNSDGNDHAHFLADRRMEQFIEDGDLYSTEYEHCFGDDELKDIAIEQGRWAYAEDAVVEHRHPMFGTAKPDKDYDNAYNDGKFQRDRETYLCRRIDRILKNKGPLIAVAFPLTDLKVYTHFMFSFLRMDKPANYCIFMPNYPGPVDVIRNELVKQAFQASCTHILMMDTDQIYSDRDMIARMMAHDKPVVGARVHRRYPPFDPLTLRGTVGKFKPVPDVEIEAAMKNGNPLVKVDATGCGCVLYSMKVFAKIHDPWFELDTNKDTKMPIGEDIAFCMKLAQHGIDIFVDCSIDIKHLTLHATDWNTWKVWQKIEGAKFGANLKPQQSEVNQNGT